MPIIAHPRGESLVASCRRGIAYTVVLKIVVSASASLVRSCEASCIESAAFSTAVTACVGSVALPVASCCAAVDAVAWVCSSELIALCQRAAEAAGARPGRAGRAGAAPS